MRPFVLVLFLHPSVRVNDCTSMILSYPERKLVFQDAELGEVKIIRNIPEPVFALAEEIDRWAEDGEGVGIFYCERTAEHPLTGVLLDMLCDCGVLSQEEVEPYRHAAR